MRIPGLMIYSNLELCYLLCFTSSSSLQVGHEMPSSLINALKLFCLHSFVELSD